MHKDPALSTQLTFIKMYLVIFSVLTELRRDLFFFYVINSLITVTSSSMPCNLNIFSLARFSLDQPACYGRRAACGIYYKQTFIEGGRTSNYNTTRCSNQIFSNVALSNP